MEQLIEAIVTQEQLSSNDESHLATAENTFNADHPNDVESPNTDKVRRKNRTPNPITWKRKRNALLREHGQSYFGIKTVVDEEGRKWCTEVPRGGRKMKPRCECKSPAFQCKKVGDEARQRLFDEFWALSWEEKRTHMSRLVVLGSVMRPRNRKDASFSRRSKSLKYYFETDGNRYRVCKTMFLNTFDLSQWSVHGWPKKWSSTADDHSTAADVDCLLDESAAATSSWFEEFIARLPNAENTVSRSKKRKTRSPSTDSSKNDVSEEWISESDVDDDDDDDDDDERVESTTISFVDVSTINGDSNDETKYGECETSTPSIDLTSQQSDFRQMLLDMSRRMEEMQDKFDKRVQSVESQLTDISQNKSHETSPIDSKFSVSSNRSMSSGDEQEADSMTESQADAQSVDNSSNPSTRSILPHINSHVQNCYRASCETCRELRRISENIETKPSPDANSLNSDELRSNRPSVDKRRFKRAVRRPTMAQCTYCFRNYDNSSQLSIHLNRHSPDEEKSCCHCIYKQIT